MSIIKNCILTLKLKLPKKVKLNIINLSILILITLLIVLLVLWPTLSSQARYYDDTQYYVSNNLVQHPSWKSVGTFFNEILFPSTVGGYYQPLSMISLMCDFSFGAQINNLIIFHITSLFLHVANVCFVIILLYLLFENRFAAALGGILFGIHPTVIESIAWVSERKTVLATFFVLLSLILYIYYTKKYKKKYLWISLIMYLLSVLSKPTTITLPILLLLLDYWPLKRLSKECILEKLAFFEITAASSLVTYISQKYTAGVTSPISHTLWHTVLLVLYNISFYINKIFLPINLSSYYPFPTPFSLNNFNVLWHVIESLIIILLILVSLKKGKEIIVGFLFFFIAILPSLGVVGFTSVIAADRFLYLPLLGFIIIFSYIFVLANNKINKKIQLKRGLMVLLLILLFFEGSANRNYIKYWSTTESIYKRAQSMAPNNPNTCNDLGNVLARDENYDEATLYYNKAIQLNPKFTPAYDSMGLMYVKQNNIEKAIEEFNKSLEINPKGIASLYLKFLEEKESKFTY